MWLLLWRLAGMRNMAWVCGGDFNEVLRFSKKQGGQEKSYRAIQSFRKALDDCGFEDLGSSGPPFTWKNIQEGTRFVQE